MGKLAYARIVLTSAPYGVVRSGSELQGVLEFQYNEPEQLRGIRIEVIGVTETAWTESETHSHGTGRNRTTTTRTVYYGFTQYHVRYCLVAWGQPSSASRKSVQNVPMGPVAMPFSVQLPYDLPESFEGSSYGYTRYFVKGVFDRPWKFDHETKLLFTVVADMNFTRLSKMCVEAVDLTNEKHISKAIRMTCCCCCPFICAGRLHYDLCLAKVGYVPGEFIGVYGTVRNETGRVLRDLRLRLVQHVRFLGARGRATVQPGNSISTSWCHSRSYSKTVVEVPIAAGHTIEEGAEVQLGHAATDSPVRLLVPALPCTRQNDGTPISIRYSLDIYLDADACLKVDRELSDIFIGNVPLENAPLFIPWPSNGQHATPSAPPNYNEAPPPSYQESVFGPQALGNWSEQKEEPSAPTEEQSSAPPRYVGEQQSAFAPKYTVYGFNV